jgi:hypothetical protein
VEARLHGMRADESGVSKAAAHSGNRKQDSGVADVTAKKTEIVI